MNHKKKTKTSIKKNKSFAKRKVRNDTSKTERTHDTIRASRRNYGEGLGL